MEKTYNEWQEVGRQVAKYEKSSGRNLSNKATFKEEQTVELVLFKRKRSSAWEKPIKGHDWHPGGIGLPRCQRKCRY